MGLSSDVITEIRRCCNRTFVAGFLVLVASLNWHGASAESPRSVKSNAPVSDANEEEAFKTQIQPLFQKFCWRCHDADVMKSGVRVDELAAIAEDKHLYLLKGVSRQIEDGAMPPEEEAQPTTEQRQQMLRWIKDVTTAARSRQRQLNGSVRRLTVPQYKNTLHDLLGLLEDLTEVLPPDGVSKDGFTNNAQTLLLSPLQIESYFDIAQGVLDLCIVDENVRPVIQNFRVDLGASINPNPCPDNLILGANSELLKNPDVLVTELKPSKPFDYQPFAMRTSYDFIEGYVGNDTIRAWKKFDSIYHSVFACMRGTPGYTKGEAYQVVQQGLLLRPAIPSSELFGQSNTYGPMANFKISLRELPDEGNFRVRIKAARYDDGLLLDAGIPAADGTASNTLAVDLPATGSFTLAVKEPGVYQVDVRCAAGNPQGLISLKIGNRDFSGKLLESAPAATNEQSTAFMLVRLGPGEYPASVKYGDNTRLRRILLTRLSDVDALAVRFNKFEQRSPQLSVYVGLRRDCGSTLTQVQEAQPVSSGEFKEYTFEGAIRDFPNPDVERDNVNYLAGVREIGVRSDYTDGRDMPRLLIRSVEFEGPYYETWPPATHRNIFIESTHRQELAVYAREVIQSFANRAFRRPATDSEVDALHQVWQRSYAAQGDFQQSIKNALTVVLTSPQFLFLIENSSTPDPEDLDSYELASKLSYFLWNAPPDQRLLDLAAQGALRQSLDTELHRMISDARFAQFANQFASQWLSLEKFDVVATDAKRFPTLTRDAKTQLRQEPVHFLKYLIEQDLPVRNLIQCDFMVANEVSANYYGMADRCESGFQFVPIRHGQKQQGGVFSLAGILAGLSDGQQSHPIKRGAWLARKIVAEPPDDPPPNVPKLPEDDGVQLSLRQKLERHRNQKGCVNCHTGIDPWGIPLEAIDAGGLLKTSPVETQSTLPDGREVRGLEELKEYLAHDRIDQVAFSFMKHLATYAVGRTLSFNEIVFLQEHGIKLRSGDYRMQDMIRFVVTSDLFLKK